MAASGLPCNVHVRVAFPIEAGYWHAGSMFWILQPATHNDYDGYSIYTDPARYLHDPKPIQPIPSPTVCSGGNSTDVRPDNPF